MVGRPEYKPQVLELEPCFPAHAGGAADGQERAGSFRMGNWIYDLGPAVHVLAAGRG